MTRWKWLTAVGVAAMTLSAGPAWAQRERSGGSETTGSASDRSSGGGGGGGGSSVSSGGGGGGSSSGGSSYSAPSSAPSSSGSGDYVAAPVRPQRAEQGRTRSGSSAEGRRSDGEGSTRAVPRGSDGAAGSTSSTARGAGSDGSAPSRGAVPTYSRPRDGRQPTGTAVDRQYPYTGGGGNTYVYSYPGYYGRYYYPGYAFGLGYFYDPSWYDPYYYGGYYGGMGYYGPGAYGGGGGGGYQGGYGRSSYGQGPTGALRLKIRPREAQVYIDGYFVGVVDSFDGVFQKLEIDSGGHRVEIRAPGFETTAFDVLITPGETVTYKGDLRRMP